MDNLKNKVDIFSTAFETLEIRSSAYASPKAIEDSLNQKRLPEGAFIDLLAKISKQSLSTLQLSLLDLQQNFKNESSIYPLLDSFPALKTINVRIESLDITEIPATLLELQNFCLKNNLTLCVDFILPDMADGFITLEDEPTAFLCSLKMSQSLVAENITVRWLVPIISALIFRIEGIFLLAQEIAVIPLLVPPERLYSDITIADLTGDEALFLWDFITYRLLESESNLLTQVQPNYYSALLHYLPGNSINARPLTDTILQYSEDHKSWQYAKQASSSHLAFISIAPLLDKAVSAFSLKHKISFILEVFQVLTGGSRAYWASLIAGFKSTDNLPIEQLTLKKALLIGAYGGEHIGDAAILGGVLYRIHQQYGITEAVLMSQRPFHTSHLIPMLDVPVDIKIDLYDWEQIRKHIENVDCIVFAGGPLIDLPKQLIRHLYAVSLARKLNKPFIAEGIGPGPFTRLPSKLIARRLLCMANSISLRTSDSAKHDLIKSLPVTVGHCPAFDYLDTRKTTLSRLPKSDISYIETLLADTEGRKIIGINIRPIGHLYTSGAQGADIEDYTKMIEKRFEQRFADGIQAYHNESKNKPCFIFFPMNAIQFGMSDILSAYRIKQVLGPDVDFRVWQSDASLDGVVKIIRKLDIAITMRFHATIFALSQQCKVIGIDYRIGKRDKVAELLDDAEQGENCTRIDQLTDHWLAEKLKNLSS